MSMSDALRRAAAWSTPAPAALGGLFPNNGQPGVRPALPLPAHRGHPLSSPAPVPCSRSRRPVPAPAARRPRRWTSLPTPAAGSASTSALHFVTPLISAVWSCAPDACAAEYPARYLFRIPRQPRHALGHRLAAVAHRGRRLRRGTWSWRPRTCRAVLLSTTPVRIRSDRHGRGRRDHRRQRPRHRPHYDAVVHRHPSAAGAGHVGGADPGPLQHRHAAQRDQLLQATRRSLHSDTSVLPGAQTGRRRRGTTCWLNARRRLRRSTSLMT